MNIVIDTNIFKKAEENINLDYMCILVYMRMKSQSISVDHEHKLENEYFDELANFDFFRKWYKEISIYYISPKINNRDQRHLKSLGLHEEEDLLVLGLANNSDKILFTEDSDFGKGNERRALENKPILDYLVDNLYLNVNDSSEALKFLHNL